MTQEDIEIAANWEGCEGVFISECLDIGWLDLEECFYVHDWQEHQPYTVRRDQRSNAARLSRLSQIDKKKHEELRQQGVKGLTKKEYDDLILGETPAKRQQTPAKKQHSPAPLPSLPFLSDPLLSIPNPSTPIKKKEVKLSTQIKVSFEVIKELWGKAANKWGFSSATGGKAALNGYKAYIDNTDDIERAVNALQALVIKKPTDFYIKSDWFTLQWLFRKTNRNRQPCDNIQSIIDGRVFVEMKIEKEVKTGMTIRDQMENDEDFKSWMES